MLILGSMRRLVVVLQSVAPTLRNGVTIRQLRGVPRQRIQAETIQPESLREDSKTPAVPRLGNARLEMKPDVHTELNGAASAGHSNEQIPAVSADSEDTVLPRTDTVEKSYAPTFNLAAYVNTSPTLQQLIKLGVDLHSIERRKGLPEFVLRLDFEEHVKPYLIFLQDQGVPAAAYGELITKNPLLFKVDMDDLQTRINYLESKKFTTDQRQRILTKNPFWLMFSTTRIDRRLGHFQKEFKLQGDDVRFLATKQPRLITYNMDHIRRATFGIREEMGFSKDEERCLLLSKPRLWMMDPNELVERFAYAYKDMKLSHDMLIQFPEVLTSRQYRLRQRHEFLRMLHRAQYDPAQDMYISPKSVVEGNDYDFVRNVAKSDMETYTLFLKTL